MKPMRFFTAYCALASSGALRRGAQRTAVTRRAGSLTVYDSHWMRSDKQVADRIDDRISNPRGDLTGGDEGRSERKWSDSIRTKLVLVQGC